MDSMIPGITGQDPSRTTSVAAIDPSGASAPDSAAPDSAAPDSAALAAAARRLARTSVMVVGDVMLDRYVYGTVERISPEAPTWERAAWMKRDSCRIRP